MFISNWRTKHPNMSGCIESFCCFVIGISISLFSLWLIAFSCDLFNVLTILLLPIALLGFAVSATITFYPFYAGYLKIE
jgi:hypothetical protein